MGAIIGKNSKLNVLQTKEIASSISLVNALRDTLTDPILPSSLLNLGFLPQLFNLFCLVSICLLSGMDPNLLQPSSDCDKSAGISCSDSLPPSSSESESDPKRRKLEEDVKVGISNTEEEIDDEEDSSDEIDDDDDDEDDAMEVKQWIPKVRTLIKRIPEDDEGLQRYIRKIKESEVDFGSAKHAHHVDNIRRCLNRVIDEQKKQGNLLELVLIQTVNYSMDIGYNYYITFEAKKKLSLDDKVYQAKVHHSIWKDINIRVFREKQQQQPLIQVGSHLTKTESADCS
ncbi:unnamed protein product [Linum tenue]|uniref:Cystatin domain-containing protein n=1 Tax=Linum tenue TaxID=586396 RepID=A0AAV0P7E3_9ROSI|nr:unnamed protein product [Linum tenue]